jgi:hypothetical protein
MNEVTASDYDGASEYYSRIAIEGYFKYSQ